MSDRVEKSIVVGLPRDLAFTKWVEEVHRWWPAGHRRSGDPSSTVVMEGREEGRFFERCDSGEEFDFGRIVEYRYPERLVLDWFLGSGPERASKVEICFSSLSEAETKIEVTHWGPERMDGLWEQLVHKFHKGWDVVLGEFQKF